MVPRLSGVPGERIATFCSFSYWGDLIASSGSLGDSEHAIHVLPGNNASETAELADLTAIDRTVSPLPVGMHGRRNASQFKESYVKTYEGANIRNVALIGHSHSGKTSLVSAMLFTAGATQRLGRVDEGNTVTDYDEEEMSRAMSLSAATAVVEWGKTKINLIDTPGFNMFIHEAEMVLPAVELGVWSWSTQSAASKS